VSSQRQTYDGVKETGVKMKAVVGKDADTKRVTAGISLWIPIYDVLRGRFSFIDLA
jgi:hypothetical protein